MLTERQILDLLPFKQFKSRRAYELRNKRAIEASGHKAVKAITDSAGDCCICHEAGRCPGYHVKP